MSNKQPWKILNINESEWQKHPGRMDHNNLSLNASIPKQDWNCNMQGTLWSQCRRHIGAQLHPLGSPSSCIQTVACMPWHDLNTFLPLHPWQLWTGMPGGQRQALASGRMNGKETRNVLESPFLTIGLSGNCYSPLQQGECAWTGASNGLRNVIGRIAQETHDGSLFFRASFKPRLISFS